MDMLPACLKGHVAMLGQRQDRVLVWVPVFSAIEIPKFSQCVGQGDRTLSPHMLVESSRLQVSRLRVVLLFAVCVPCWHQQAENGLRNIWASHPMAECPA